MDNSSTIPVMSQAASLMHVGPNGNNLAATAQSRHPVDQLQRHNSNNNNADYQSSVRHMYGSGLAMTLATERAIAMAQERGAAGLPSSGLYADIVSGNDGKLDFADFLNRAEYRPDLPKENPHLAMERQLRML
jgi:hypothetical protein